MKFQRFIKLSSLLLICISVPTAFGETTILTGMDMSAVNDKVKDLVQKMTLNEKILLMVGDRTSGRPGGPTPVPRLGIPSYPLAHGPHSARPTLVNPGVKPTVVHGTFMANSINYAASWDPDLIRRVAVGVAQEVRCSGDCALAGPALNIIRDLRCGRSAEYYTEDPYLNARTSVAFVEGIQSQDVIAIIKHFACNNQEWNRSSIDVKVSKRALNEIYLPGFEYCITEAKAFNVMSAYNKVNGTYCAENSYLLTDVLRKKWGFQGMVMSDWSGTHSTVPTVKAGLDLEMPRERWFGSSLKKAVESKAVPIELIDERVSNILRSMFVAKCFDPNYKNPPKSVFKSAAEIELSHQLALGSIILLKNENNLLPFDKTKTRKVAVIGPHANYGPQYNGGKYSFNLYQEGGSARVQPDPADMITPFQGIQDLVGSGVEVKFAPGCYAENGCGPIPSKYLRTSAGKPGLNATYYQGKFEKATKQAVDPTISFESSKDQLIPEAGKNEKSDATGSSVRWEGKLVAPATRTYVFELRIEGTARLIIDGKPLFDSAGNHGEWWHQIQVNLDQGEHDLKVEYVPGSKQVIAFWWDYENNAWKDEAVELAKSSDAVILNVGNTGRMEGEGNDRFQGILLSRAQEDLINAVCAVNQRTVAVTFTAGVGMDHWVQSAPAIVQAMYPGQQAGKALAELLFGQVNPSGKLTVSIPKSEAQYPKDHWMEEKNINYTEGVFVGYRYFDQQKIEPQWAFGHGLSYTTFSYGQPKISAESIKVGELMTVKLPITNTGSRAGAEVVQLYVHDTHSSAPRPPKELKGFQKVFLNPGETKTVTLTLDKRSFAYYSEEKDDWVVEPGSFELQIGSSSRDIRQKVMCTVAANYPPKYPVKGIRHR